MESFEQSKEEIDHAFLLLSMKKGQNEENKEPKIKISDLPLLMTKLEEALQCNLTGLKDYISEKFNLSNNLFLMFILGKTKYSLTSLDLYQAVNNYL